MKRSAIMTLPRSTADSNAAIDALIVIFPHKIPTILQFSCKRRLKGPKLAYVIVFFTLYDRAFYRVSNVVGNYLKNWRSCKVITSMRLQCEIRDWKLASCFICRPKALWFSPVYEHKNSVLWKRQVGPKKPWRKKQRPKRKFQKNLWLCMSGGLNTRRKYSWENSWHCGH